MQTSFIVAESQYEPSAPSIPLPRLLERPVDDSLSSLSHLSRLTFVSRPKDRGLDASAKIADSIAYMTQNLNRPLQVSTLAALVNISPSHYFALFKRHTGHAPMDYFTRLRMEEARRLLDTTQSSVKEVAAALGYDDPFYFSRVFKSVNRLAPSNYRIHQREGVTQSEKSENSLCKT